MSELARHLAGHCFRDLFIEVLGWDHAAGDVELTDEGRAYMLSIVAQKRGMLVLHCRADHETLYDRGRLRRLQRKLATQTHEHLVIYSCETPRKQVWQWAVRLEDGRRLRHREHPFFSVTPPPRLLQRLKRLRFSLEEEEDVTLLDALGRVRGALDQSAEFNLFAKRPRFAQRSHQLARAMATGGEAEFHEFVLFHRPLVSRAVKPLVYLYGGEKDDAEQAGWLGLIHAARRYEPNRGLQFSTYAVYCIQGYCKRHAPQYLAHVRLPMHVVWPCVKLRARLRREYASGGPSAMRRYLDELASRDPGLAREWVKFQMVTEMRSLSQPGEPAYREARNLPDGGKLAWSRAADSETAELVRRAVDCLKQRDSVFVRLKYGLNGREHTLEMIGQQYGITRERVRQRLVKAHEQLACRLAPLVAHTPEGN